MATRKIYIHNHKTGTGAYYDATVGTKYLTVTMEYGRKERFGVISLERDVNFSNTYGLKYTAYNTEQEYLDTQESYKIRQEIASIVKNFKNSITLQQLQAAKNILTLL